MRISTLQIFGIASNAMGKANSDIVETQTQISTGQRILTPSDDPVATAKILELDRGLARIEQYGKNIDIAENNLSLEEATLDSITSLVQRVRELAVQAGNTATYSPEDYDALASEVDSRLEELQNLLNTKNSAGDYIFAGYKGGDQPFVGSSVTGFDYTGTEGQMNIKISDSTSIATSDSGKDLFVDIESLNNTVNTSASSVNRANPPGAINFGQIVDQEAYDEFYPEDMVITFQEDSDVIPAARNFTITERSTGNVIEANHVYVPGEELVVNGVRFSISGLPAAANGAQTGDQFFIESSPTQDVLTTLARFSDAMKNMDGTTESRDLLEDVVAQTLDNLDSAQTNIQEVTAAIGARLNTLESTRELHLDTELVSNEILSDLKDLDYAEAASRLSAQTLILEAAQAAFSKVSQLTLFSRL